MENGQSITLNIAGKDYPLKALSPEQEQAMRIAAETINQRLKEYDTRYPGKTLVDKLAFVTLNEATKKIFAQKRLSDIEEKINSMLSETNAYLDSIETK